MSESFAPATILAGLGPAPFPHTIRCLHSIGSTMDVARELLPTLSSAQLPLLVTADVQTAGRGRLGRRWEAPPGAALLLSLALRPDWLPPEQGVALVWLTATALCEAVEEVAEVRAALKWPNDLLLPTAAPGRQPGHAKAAGILLEVSVSAGRLDWAIIGCGVNVSAAPPPALTRYPATSVAAAAGRPVERLALLQALLRRMGAWHARLAAGTTDELYAAWRGRLHGLGTAVRVETGSSTVEGRAEDVDRTGALLVRDGAGRLHTITTGDVGLTG